VKRFVLLALLAGCPHKPKQKIEPATAKHDAAAVVPPVIDADSATLQPSPPLPAVPAGLPQPPTSDAITPDAVAYGGALFTDPALSKSGKTSCATCHRPDDAYSGVRDMSDGGEVQPVRTPALVNLAWATHYGWDGKITDLRAFLAAHFARELGNVAPPATPLYAAYDARIGGERPWIGALQAFVLTRYAGDSAWDRVERAHDRPKDLDDGYKLFVGKAGCAHCHAPPLYTDGAIHDGYLTPSIRALEVRPALLHDGTVFLETLLDHHGDAKLSPTEKSSLVAFLKAL
jgi:cytochrome c peroxidase